MLSEIVANLIDFFSSVNFNCGVNLRLLDVTAKDNFAIRSSVRIPETNSEFVAVGKEGVFDLLFRNTLKRNDFEIFIISGDHKNSFILCS